MDSPENVSGKFFSLKTNGSCFICLDNIGSSKGVDSSSISNLLRYLNVDMKQIFSSGAAMSTVFQLGKVVASLERSDVNVQLCEQCQVTNGNLTKLVDTLRKLQIDIDLCLHTIQERILKAVGDSAKQNEYQLKMASDIATMLFADLVDNLRNDVLKKCVTVISEESPKVLLKRVRNIGLNFSTAKPRPMKSDSDKFLNGNPEKITVNEEKPSTSQFVELNGTSTNTVLVASDSENPWLSEADADEIMEEDLSFSSNCAIFPEEEKVFQVHLPEENYSDRVEPEVVVLQRNEPEQDDYCRDRFICEADGCSREFNQLYTLQKHMKIHHSIFISQAGCISVEQPSTSATLTSTSIPSKDLPPKSLRYIRRFHKSRKLKCNKCEHTILTSDYFTNPVHHCITAENHVFESGVSPICNICQKKFNTVASLDCHYKDCHQTILAKCGLCSKSFYKLFWLTKHYNAAHNDSPVAIRCNNPSCKNIFQTVNDFVVHQALAHSSLSPVKKIKEVAQQNNPSDRESSSSTSNIQRNEFILPD